MSAVSTNYRELAPEEVAEVAAECAEAWKNPDLPMRQYELCVKPELARFRAKLPVAPYDALIRCWIQMPVTQRRTLLDIGASCGYYDEVLRLAGIVVNYTGVDYSEAFAALARDLYPGIQFDVADACQLPYPDGAFDVVLSGAIIMHIRDYPRAIREAVRVARRFVIFHRTPVHHRPTTFYRKEAYGVPCLEVLFEEAELLNLFRANNLQLLYSTDVSWDSETQYGHRSYLAEKLEVEPYASCKAV